MDNGWETSADAWIADQGEQGDFGRRYVLDPVMLPRALARQPTTALDVGCGEGRFCRMLKANGVDAVGIDPTASLLARARALDPAGRYEQVSAEQLPFETNAFDLVVSYLSLIDIPNIEPAIAEMARVLRPGGALLIANLNGFNTASADTGWVRGPMGEPLHFPVDKYLEERAMWIAYRGIRVVNHHRPLSAYMQALLDQALRLPFFAEPEPTPDAPAEKAARYRRVPWFLVMEWTKQS